MLRRKHDLDFFQQETAEENRHAEREIMSGVREYVDVELEELWPDGRQTWQSATKIPLVCKNGKVL